MRCRPPRSGLSPCACGTRGPRDVPTYVALIRGINVGGKNSLPMAELRAATEAAGYTDVRTYIQSGNMLLSSPKEVKGARLASLISARFDLDVAVMVRSAAELAAALAANPFPDADTDTLHIGFMNRAPAAAAAAAVDGERFLPERFALAGRELYLHLPAGLGRAKLPVFLGRALKEPTTIRNWRTLRTLVEMAG